MRSIASLLSLALCATVHAAPPKPAKTVTKPKTSAGKTVERPKRAPEQQITAAQRLRYQAALKAARAAQKAGDLAKAVAQFEIAVAAWPDDPRALGERGWARYKQGKLAEAEADLRGALARTGNSNLRGSQLYNLGRVHEAAGRVPEAIAAYRASLTARPHPAVRSRLATLTKAPASALATQPAKTIASLEAFCKAVDTELDEGDTPACTETDSQAALDGVNVRLYEHTSGVGERTFHLLFTLPSGAIYAQAGVFTEYNPGAFGISEQVEHLDLSVRGKTVVLHTRKQRSDSDMGLNEIEFETAETHTFCGMSTKGPRCTDAILTAYDGSRQILHDEDDEPGMKHDLWATKWALSVKVTADAVQFANAGAKLPKEPGALVGTHPLRW